MKNQEALPNRSLWRKLRGRNCLIIRTGALGDALLTLPLLRALKFSGARRVVVLGTPGSWRFLSNKVSGAFEVELWDAGDFRWAGLFSNMASLSQECLERLKPFSRAYLFQKNVTVYAPSPLVGEGWGGGGEPVVLKSTPTISSPIEGEGKNGNSRERLQKNDVERTKEILLSAGIPRVFVAAPPVAENKPSDGHAAFCLLKPWLDEQREKPADADAGVDPALGRGGGERENPFVSPAAWTGRLSALLSDGWSAKDEPWLATDEEDVRRVWRELLEARQALFKNGLGGCRRRWAVLHPGAGGRKKCAPLRTFAWLAGWLWRRYRTPSVVLIGPADQKNLAEFRAAAPKRVPLIYWENRSLMDVKSLLSCAHLFCGNDSGIAHLAARFTRTAVFFGPTRPSVWRPRGPNVIVINAPFGELTELQPDRIRRALLCRDVFKQNARKITFAGIGQHHHQRFIPVFRTSTHL